MAGRHGDKYADLALHRPKWWQRAVGKGLCTIMWLWVLHRARKDGPVVLGWRHPWDGHGHGGGHGQGGGGGGLAEGHVHGEDDIEEETVQAEVKIEALPMKEKDQRKDGHKEPGVARKDHHKDRHKGPEVAKKDHHKDRHKEPDVTKKDQRKDRHKEPEVASFAAPAPPAKGKNLRTYDLADSRERQKAVKDALYAALRDGDHEQLESAIAEERKGRGAAHSHNSRSSKKVSESDAGPKGAEQLKAPKTAIPLSKEQMLRKAIEDHPKLLSLLKDDQ
ncbi:hypothetical protein Mapa_008213 [Marchantia paleacea]|nr:hypothetical protein Mapa_008213 [Marchantia paleacea]